MKNYVSVYVQNLVRTQFKNKPIAGKLSAFTFGYINIHIYKITNQSKTATGREFTMLANMTTGGFYTMDSTIARTGRTTT